MKNAPRLLNYNNNAIIAAELFSDFQIDKILSAQTIAVLQHPCTKNEIANRNEIFVLLEKDEYFIRMENTLSVLSNTEKAIALLRDAKLQIDRYYRTAQAFDTYINSCEVLASMYDFGSLFYYVSSYFSSEEFNSIIDRMKSSSQSIKSLLCEISVGLLSFSDTNWLTPDYEAVTEFDHIAECAKKLGFSVSERKGLNTKLNYSLTDTVCRLHADKIQAIEEEISKFSSINLNIPTTYISEIKFFLEIHKLIKKATEAGASHSIAKIADSPAYTAKEIYDVSLLAQNCKNIIPNDAFFSQNEPFFFLTGANGGGKTTYLRTIGINLIFFLTGCPVFAKDAIIYPFDTVLSHFPKDERFDNTGRLDEEYSRAEKMIEQAKNSCAFFFFNETFSGTDDVKGFKLLTEIAEKIKKDSHFGLYVTHFHNVKSLDYPILSAEVNADDTSNRTFRITKSKGSTSSYALDILRKYRLDKDSLAVRRCEHGN